MSDEEILARGGDERDIAEYAKQNGATYPCDGNHRFVDGVCQNDDCGFAEEQGEVFAFDKKNHVYTLDGRPLTGTTTVLGVIAKPQLISWAAKMVVEYIRANAKKQGRDYLVEPLLLTASQNAHTQKKDDAAKHGTDAHATLEAWIKYCIKYCGGVPTAVDMVVDEKGITYQIEPIEEFVKWAIRDVDHFLFSERMMYHKAHWFAGTADFAYVGKDGKRYLGDFKTSSGIYGIGYWCQVAAYRFLAEAQGDAPYDAMIIVRLGKDGAFEVQSTLEYALFRDTFFACLTIYRSTAKVDELVRKH